MEKPTKQTLEIIALLKARRARCHDLARIVNTPKLSDHYYTEASALRMIVSDIKNKLKIDTSNHQK